LNKNKLEKIINEFSRCKLDFVDIYYQKGISTVYSYEDSKLNYVNSNIYEGIGIRTILGDNQKYAHSNDFEEVNINKLITDLKSNYETNLKTKKVKLIDENVVSQEPIIPHKKFSNNKKKEIMSRIDKLVRNYDKRIVQVQILLMENSYDVIIANSNGKYVKEKRNYTRLFASGVAKENEKTTRSYESVGITGGYELLNDTEIEEMAISIASSIIKKLDAVSIKGGNMPVIIESGFGAVIFHEACGHALEATTVSKNISVLSGKLGQKIASDKVTIVDDGTLYSGWGSTVIDDEGNKTQRNVLIENGILKNYLIDIIGSIRMKMPITGSGRKEDYTYLPTSRMNNTFLMPGNDKFEDMVKSIKYGLYAKKMGGGSVDPITGDFNFSVSEAYIIKDGKIGNIVKSASLIGNTLDILNNVEMVSDNLKNSPGLCGSESGDVPVYIGQPTIKVSSILVGGDK
jgi:TldD protein